jgi:hypothetical protein
MGSNLPEGVTAPLFEPLQVARDHMKFSLTLPRESGASGEQLQEDATVDLRAGIAHAVQLPLPHFQSVFDAMSGGSAVLFQGNVEIDLGMEQPEILRFTARFDDTTGDLLTTTVTKAGKIATATLSNSTESLVRVTAVRGTAHAPDGSVELTVEGDAPAEVNPGEQVKVKLVADADITGDVVVEVDAQPVPDKEAIWESVLDRSTAAAFRRKVSVKGTYVFQAQATQTDPIVALLVDFERGDTVELNAELPTADAMVEVAIDDVVLRAVQDSTYSYTMTAHRQSGAVQEVPAKEDHKDILIPSVPAMQADPA